MQVATRGSQPTVFSPLLIVLSYVSSSMLHGFDWFGLPLEGTSEDCSSLRKKSVYLPKCQQYYATQLRHESCDQFSVLCACTPPCVRACVCPHVCVYTYVSYVLLRSRPSVGCNPSPSLAPLPSACVPPLLVTPLTTAAHKRPALPPSLLAEPPWF